MPCLLFYAVVFVCCFLLFASAIFFIGFCITNAIDVFAYVCQSCGFDFETVYGPAGREYIEAHHLTPLAELPEDTPVPLDPKEDFAVLCANCHRMMHRKDGPRTLAELKALARGGMVHTFHNRLHDRVG